MGRAIVLWDVGVLCAYFGENRASNMPSGDADALRAAVVDLRDHPEKALRRIERAQDRMRSSDGLNSPVFVLQHAAWSRERLAPP